MKLTHIAILLTALACAPLARAEKLVILHTNDTHSQIDPDDKDGRGGIARRKVLVDSVRSADPNVILVDAGDAVQGTLYFNIFHGEVEQKLMNALGYDLRILGNHEFDNGIDNLASMLALSESPFISTNYNLDDTPLRDRFGRYAIREVGGRRVGFIGINLQPKGMIADGNYNGLEYLDAIEAANASAWWLKNIERCDMVVAVSHIGYDPSVAPGDIDLAGKTRNIDVIIGGHSHDLIEPEGGRLSSRLANLNGDEVLVTQAGKQGKVLGKITLDLDDLTSDYELISVDSRLDNRLDPEFTALIAPYRAGVDSLMSRPVGRTARELQQSSADMINWVTDMALQRGSQMADGVDFALINKGGIRRGLPKGTITEGQILTMLPFNNHIEVIDILGADISPALVQMARVGGNGVSKGVEVECWYNGGEPVIEQVLINGKPLEADSTYRVATIDYMANGGDYMPTLANHTLVARSENVFHTDVLDHIKALRNRKINPDPTVRFKLK